MKLIAQNLYVPESRKFLGSTFNNGTPLECKFESTQILFEFGPNIDYKFT